MIIMTVGDEDRTNLSDSDARLRKTLNNAVAGVDDIEWHSLHCDGTCAINRVRRPSCQVIPGIVRPPTTLTLLQLEDFGTSVRQLSRQNGRALWKGRSWRLRR